MFSKVLISSQRSLRVSQGLSGSPRFSHTHTGSLRFAKVVEVR